MARKSVPAVPHSWSLVDWEREAPDVAPNTVVAARWLVRNNRESLVQAGALVRVGRKLVIMGAAYHSWLVGHAHCVADFHVPVHDEAHRTESGAAA
jgi:hypothetical protein